MSIFDKKYRFTSNRHSKKGMMALIFGMISLISFFLAMIISIRTEGELAARMGGAGLFALIFAMVGLMLGFMATQEPDVFPLLPKAGFAVSVISVILWILLVYIGIVGLSYD